MRRGATLPIVVLGAGLSGLSASVELRRAGVPHRTFEKEHVPGGLARTREEAGYRFDHTGHLLHVRDPALRAEITGWLGEGAALEIDRRSVVYSHGVYTRYPFQANVHGLPKEVAYACVEGFVRAHFDASPREVRTFEDFCLRHFGEAISRAFMIPYNEKLWGAHPREIAADWCDRFVPVPKLEDVLRGAFGVAQDELGYNTRFLYPRLGAGEIARAFAQRAGPVETGRAPSRIDWRQRTLTVDDEVVSYEAIVSSIPLQTLVGVLVEPPPEVLEASARLRCTHLYYLDVALNTPCEQDWHWAYVPEPEIPFYRVGAYSTMSAAMAPPNKGSLYVELADRATPDLSTLLPRVADALIGMRVIRAREAIRFARVRRLDHAYVIFDAARSRAVETIQGFLAEHGVRSVGRYGEWTYASMEDAIRAGRSAARALSGAPAEVGVG